jgi:hypothetical protein
MKNTTVLGSQALSHAIHYFITAGYVVSIPMIDAQAYDLIVDNGTPQRVQVKYTSQKNKWGWYDLHLATYAYGKYANLFDTAKVDLLYVLTPEDSWLIPIADITAKTGIQLGPKYSNRRIAQ